MALKSYSASQLRTELERRERSAKKIQAKRDKLARELATLDKELAALGVRGGRSAPAARRSKSRTRKGTRRRPRNTLSLADAITAAMDKGAVVSPAEAARLVKSNGYKTTSKTFGIQVAGTLAKDARFKRIGRGQYERVK